MQGGRKGHGIRLGRLGVISHVNRSRHRVNEIEDKKRGVASTASSEGTVSTRRPSKRNAGLPSAKGIYAIAPREGGGDNRQLGSLDKL